MIISLEHSEMLYITTLNFRSTWALLGLEVFCVIELTLAELTALGEISSESTVLEAEGFLPTDVRRVSFRGAGDLPPLGSGFSLL